jgi:DNA-binding NarL/FixJ family response regulator
VVEQVVLTLVGEAAPSAGTARGPDRTMPRARVPAASVGLTPRELEILTLLAAGLSTTAAARDLGVSVNTVRGHVKNLLSKLGAHSQVEAVVTALRRGILTLD